MSDDANAEWGELPVDAELVSDVPVAAVVEPVELAGPPRPGLGLSIALALLPLAAQVVVGLGLAVVLFALLLFGLGQKRVESLFQLLLFPVGTSTTLLVAVAAAVALYRRETIRALGLRGMTFWQAIALLLYISPLVVVSSELTNVAAEVVAYWLPDWIETLSSSHARSFEMFAEQPLGLVLLAGCLLPGIGEEILCRGVLSRGLIARYGVIVGTLLASFLFGAMHIEPIQALGAFVLGIGLQYVFLTTRSLAAPMLVHIGNNALALVLMRISESYYIPGLSALPGGETAHTPPLLLGSALAGLAAAIWLLARLRTRWVLEDGSEWSPGYPSTECPPPEARAVPVTGRPDAIAIVTAAALCAATVGIAAWIAR